MKHKHFKHLFTALLLLCTTAAFAHDFEYGGIYYNILSEEAKTVEVTYKGASPNEYLDEYSGSVVIPSTVVSSFVNNVSGWTSTNKNNSSTSQTSYRLTVEAGDVLKFDWSVSSESNCDWLTITLDGTEIVKKSGTDSGSYEKTFDTAGTHDLVVKYTKDSSQSSNNDEGKIFNIRLIKGEVEYRVARIGSNAFEYCTGLTSITIPNSVINIGNYAFYDCTGLTNFVIPNSVTSIGQSAFFSCDALTSIKIPNSVKSIGNYAFQDCNFLTSIEIPNSVTSIGNGAFFYCNSLTGIVIPNSVTSIGEKTFNYCYSLTSFEIPSSVTSIGESAFESCSRLTSIVIPKSVTSIGSHAFYLCSGLTSINVESGNTIYDSRENCNAIIETATNTLIQGCNNSIIPNSVTRIEEYAFINCSGLTSIVIPNRVRRIGTGAFKNCQGLTSVTSYATTAPTISNNVFNGISSTAVLKYPAGSDYSAWSGYFASTEEIAIGGNCGTNANWTLEGVVLKISGSGNMDDYSYDSMPWYEYKSEIKSVIINSGITNIGNYAFYGCSALTSVVIGNSVTSIGSSAFYNCSDLTSVVFGNSVTSIGNYAFYNCSGLTSVVFGNSVTSIGRSAFSGCSGLTDIEIPNSVTSIGSSAFYGCSGLTSVVIGNSVTSIGSYAFCGCTGLTSVEIPNSVTSIGGSAFSGCSGLEKVCINDLAAWCGIDFGTSNANPLYYAKNLYLNDALVTELVIPADVTEIKGYTFSHCSSLTSVVIPNSVTSIASYAFNNCKGLTSVTSLIPADELFAIDSNVFYNVDKTTCTLYVPYGAKETYAATAAWSEFVNIVELEPSELTITINEYGCATYCSTYALDFSEVDGLKAYNAIGYKPSTQTVTLARVMTSGAGQGIFIKGEPGEYAVPVIDNFDEYTLNLFVGTLEQTTVNNTAGEMSNYKFTVAELDEAPMFYPFEDNTTFSAGKAYLQIPTAWLPATAQKSLNIRFDDGETTDIDELKGESGEVKTIYDLQGRVVENPTSGIYIINGKKVVIK